MMKCTERPQAWSRSSVMKLLLLTSSSLSSRSGPSARLSLELKKLSEMNQITILCLGKEPDDVETRNAFPDVVFAHSSAEYEGWSVTNINNILRDLSLLIDQVNPDLVVLNMEIWDLMKALSSHLRNRMPFATIFHAMPFLGAPVFPTGNFEKDVLKYANSGLEEYRKDYILAHYKEASDVLKTIRVIANNKTVAYYLLTYFPDLEIYTQLPAFTALNHHTKKKEHKVFTYDFVYMARMEAGKGVEYLSRIMSIISMGAGRVVSLAILGRTDDIRSKASLDKLLAEAAKSKEFDVTYLGWADDLVKESVLSTSRVFLYPSYYDNYATVLNEALSFGLPCVTWDVPFTRLNYASTDAVSMATFENLQKFAEYALSALQDREMMSTAAQEFIDEFDTSEVIAKADADLFNRIAQKGYYA